MKYTPKQYAAALIAALKEKKGEERKKTMRRFLALVVRKGDGGKLGLMVREFEKQYLRQEGLKKVALESAGPVSDKLREELETIFGKNIFLQEKINPRLLAGVKILVNDELLVDASAEIQLQKLFS